MGVIERVMAAVFGGGEGLRQTVEIFRENAENAAQRDAKSHAAALAQFATEFERAQQRSVFDRLMDGVNRLPRPALALGTLGLFVAAMVDPVWFAARMTGIALVPEPLWWLLGAVVSFYFGARHQAKGQEFQRSIAQTLARAPQVQTAIEGLERGRALNTPTAADPPDLEADANPALDEWRQDRDR